MSPHSSHASHASHSHAVPHISRSAYKTEYETFAYSSPVHKHLCLATSPATVTSTDWDALATDTSIISLSEWLSRYSGPTDAQLLSRVTAWFAAEKFELEDVCVLAERGHLALKDVLSHIWPVYYQQQRQTGAQTYDVIDEWFCDAIAEMFSEVISRASSANAAAEHRIKTAFTEFDEEWGVYRPLRPMPPNIPIDGIPPVIQDYIKEVARYGEVGESMVTGLVLGILGSAVSGTVRLELTNGHTEPLNPAVLVLADSGGRKTSTMNTVKKPLVEIEKQLRKKEDFESRMRKIKLENIEKEITAKSRPSKTDSSTAPKKTVSELAAEARELDQLRNQKLVLESENKTWRTVIGNITPEELGHFIGRSWTHAAAMISDDTNLFNQIKDVYGTSGDKQDLYLITISGGGYSNDRRGTAPYTFDYSALSVTVMYQDDRFEQFLRRNPDVVSSGFISRFCVVYAPKMLSLIHI